MLYLTTFGGGFKQISPFTVYSENVWPLLNPSIATSTLLTTANQLNAKPSEFGF